MATVNQKLESLTRAEVDAISDEYLRGYHDLMRYGFRIKGFNHKREAFGLEPLTPEMSFDYRINYIRAHYMPDEIRSTIREYLMSARVGDTRWSGIELFGCRFGREYARAFKTLLGSHEYRELSEGLRVRKLEETQMQLYGGIGLAGSDAKDKAVQTNMVRYGVENPMQNAGVQAKLASVNMNKYGGVSPFCSDAVLSKARQTRLSNLREAILAYKRTGMIDEHLFRQSPHEFVVMHYLCSRFGSDDIYYQYGLHPYDARYPYSCDFYVKSLDLFIELNCHYSHGDHWFDANDHDDVLRKQHLLMSDSKRSRNAVKVWTETDVEKRQKAALSGIRYLVFWDGSCHQENHNRRIPNLADFMQWFQGYQCDYDSFVRDHPENTY